MTEAQLKLELECYQMYINPGCDINELSGDEIEDFFNYYKKSECYLKDLSDNIARVPDSEILEQIKDLQFRYKTNAIIPEKN